MIGSRSDQERFLEFVRVWGELREEAKEDRAVVLVEGEKDRRALRRLGLEAHIALVHEGRSLSAIAHTIGEGNRRAIVLTDWDRKGGQLAEKLSTLLEAGDFQVNRQLRQRLARVLRGELVHVEGMFRWATRLSETVGIALGPALDDGEALTPLSPRG